MPTIFATLDPRLQALLATVFTWGVTAVGAALVFFARGVSRRILDGMLGFAAGVMMAASFWSLLAPAIDLAAQEHMASWLPPAIGFLAGGGLIWGLDRLLPHLHPGFPRDAVEGRRTGWSGTTLLVLAITLHNFPEGLAVGVAFGAVASAAPGATLGAAVALAIGIALQNFPEGVAVSMPLRREGLSRLKSFWYGQLTAVVEPVAGLLGATFALSARAFLPYALSFAAGAMIFVVVEEVIPESQRGGNTDLAVLTLIGGFTVMMVLDVALG